MRLSAQSLTDRTSTYSIAAVISNEDYYLFFKNQFILITILEELHTTFYNVKQQSVISG